MTKTTANCDTASRKLEIAHNTDEKGSRGYQQSMRVCFERAQKDGLPLKQVSSGDRNTGTIGYRLQK